MAIRPAPLRTTSASADIWTNIQELSLAGGGPVVMFT